LKLCQARGTRGPSSNEGESVWPEVGQEEKANQIMEIRKKAPMIEIREPKEETVFHF